MILKYISRMNCNLLKKNMMSRYLGQTRQLKISNKMKLFLKTKFLIFKTKIKYFKKKIKSLISNKMNITK
jgi:hypothetical protein